MNPKVANAHSLQSLIFASAMSVLLCALVAEAKPKAPKSELEALRLQAGDESSNDVRAVKTEMLVSASETLAIEQAKKLIKKHLGTPLEADLQFRLAELYMRRSKTARFFEINRESETIVRLAPQVIEKESSRRLVEQAIATYDLIQKKYPKFKDLDLVIFNNAFARQQLGQEREAERLYWSLIQNFRNSPLVPECHLAIGEINFDRANFSFALEHFNAIHRYTESRVYPYGLYKAAWSHYNLHDPESGLKKLEEVVAYGKFVADRKIEARLDLRKEALGDMTVFYEDVYPAKGAFAYFKKQASELDVGPTILRLAKIYDRHSRYNERQIVLSDFIKNIPDSPHIATVESEVIWNWDAMKKKEMAVEEMKRLAAICQTDSSWMKLQVKVARDAKEADPQAACLALLRDASLKLAGRWLKIWKKSPVATDYADSAESAYAIYLKGASDSDEASDARFAYAELLFQRNKFRPASLEYAKVAAAKTTTGTVRHDAGYGAVVSLEKAVGEKWSDSDEKSFHELATQYVRANPKGQFRLDVEFKSALIAYEKNRYDEAGPLFLRLGREFAKTEKGLRAQDLYLDILNLKKDYVGLRDYSKDLLRNEADSGRMTKLQKIYEQAYFLQVQGLEESHQYDRAITQYKEFAKANPKSDLAEKAFWNAIQLHYKTLDFAGGALASEQFADKFPTSKNSLDALLKAAQSYESMGQLERAADVLEKIAKADEKSALKWHSLAADFYLLSGQMISARKTLTELRKSADAATSAMALQKLLLVEKPAGGPAYKELLGLVAASGTQPQASFAKVEMVEAQFAAGQMTEAFNEAKKVLSMSGAGSFAKSRARMVQARVLEDEFFRQSVKARAEKVATVLAIKTEKLEKAQQAFQQAIKYGDPVVSVEALKRLAGCYGHYVESLKTMPTPAGFSPEEELAFREELSKLSIPLEEKTIETLQQAYTAALKLRQDPSTLAEIKRQLQKLNMPVPTESFVHVDEPGIILPSVQGVGS